MKKFLLCLASALLLSLSCVPPAQANVYALCTNVKAVQTAPQLFVQPFYDATGSSISVSQAFQVTVTCVGTCSATVQIVGSNDLTDWIQGTAAPATVIWVNYGSTVTATGTNTATTSAQGLTSFALYGAYVTAISGTNAVVSCNMSA